MAEAMRYKGIEFAKAKQTKPITGQQQLTVQLTKNTKIDKSKLKNFMSYQIICCLTIKTL